MKGPSPGWRYYLLVEAHVYVDFPLSLAPEGGENELLLQRAIQELSCDGQHATQSELSNIAVGPNEMHLPATKTATNKLRVEEKNSKADTPMFCVKRPGLSFPLHFAGWKISFALPNAPSGTEELHESSDQVETAACGVCKLSQPLCKPATEHRAS